MKITVLGAAGKAGSRVVAEALSRGHEVTAVVRNPAGSNDLPVAAKVRAGDVGIVEDVARYLATAQRRVRFLSHLAHRLPRTVDA